MAKQKFKFDPNNEDHQHAKKYLLLTLQKIGKEKLQRIQKIWNDGGAYPLPDSWQGTPIHSAKGAADYKALGRLIRAWMADSLDGFDAEMYAWYGMSANQNTQDAVDFRAALRSMITEVFPAPTKSTVQVKQKGRISTDTKPTQKKSSSKKVSSSSLDLGTGMFGSGMFGSEDSEDVSEDDSVDLELDLDDVESGLGDVERVVSEASDAVDSQDGSKMTEVSDYTLSYQTELKSKLDAARTLKLINKQTYDFLYTALSELCQFARNNPRSRHNPRRNRRGRL